MSLFNKYNLPITLVVGLLVWSWFSLFSVILSPLY